MGNTYEVWAWMHKENIDDYEYVIKYSGGNLGDAITTMKQLKQDGIGCIKFLWR